MRLVYLTALFSCFVALSVARAESPVRWRDTTSGASFLILPGQYTWAEAEKACRDKGWDLFNIEYLSGEEQDRFLASEQLASLQWDRSFVGEPGEVESAEVWGSSDMNTNRSAAGIYKYADETKRRRRYFWRDPSSTRQAICMYLSHSWQTCTVPIHCTAGSSGSYYFATESGRTKQEATQRLQNQVSKIPHDMWTCGANLDDVRCEVVRPR